MEYTSETMLVKSKDSGESGIFAEVSAGQAGWDYLNMAAMRLRRGESFSVETREHENATVILGGVCDIVTSDGEFKNVGRRPDVFSGMPYALYISRHKSSRSPLAAIRWNSPLAGYRPIRTSRRNWSRRP